MKKITLLFIFLIGAIAINQNIQAQHINVNINIGSQPAWGPIGYDYVDYYYLPDINVYYIVSSHNYVYLDGSRWITARYLPYRYRNHDLYNMYKVVLIGGSRNPWRYNNTHYREYSRYRNNRGQSVIRDSRETRYRESRNNNSPWYRESSPNRVATTTRPNTRPSNNSNVRPGTNARPTNRPTSSSNRSTSVSNSNRGSDNRNSTRATTRSGSTNTRTSTSRR